MVERLGSAAQCGKTPIGQFRNSGDVMQGHGPVGRLERRRKPLPQSQGTRSRSGAVLRLLRRHHAQAGQVPRSRNLVQGRDQIRTSNTLLSKPAGLCAGEAKQIERGPRALRRSRPPRTEQQRVSGRFGAYSKTEKRAVTSDKLAVFGVKHVAARRSERIKKRSEEFEMEDRRI